MRGRAVFANKDLSLTPGLFGRITHRGLASPTRACWCPTRRSAPTRTAASSTWSAPTTRSRTKVVRPGPRIDGYRVIREGLKGDETIVINGLMRVRPGIEVQPKMTELPPSREPSDG